MGAGQIGGIATMRMYVVDIDFRNAAGFQGVRADPSEGQFIVHYLSHALMFCVGTLIEAHVVLTPAVCVYGEKNKFEVFAGTHKFLLRAGIKRVANHLCIHKAYNHTMSRFEDCTTANLALLVLNKQFSFHTHEDGADFIINRVRYGMVKDERHDTSEFRHCRYFGWGSRRNGFLMPLLIHAFKVNMVVLPKERCLPMWDYKDQYLCIQQYPCKSEKYGALCPDDVGSIIECSGFLVGMMVSRLVDRPCGVGFIDLQKYTKFLTCGVDDARDVIEHDDFMEFDFENEENNPRLPSVITVPVNSRTEEI